MTRRAPAAGKSPTRRAAAKAMRPPDGGHVIAALLELSKAISFEMSEETLVGRYGAALTRLLPGRALALRVVDPRHLEPTSEHTTGEISPEARAAPLSFKPSALTKMRVSPELVRSGRIAAEAVYRPIFHDTVLGFSVPLVASGELLGALHVEYPLGTHADLPSADESTILPLANQLAVALRNVKLAEETLYLRDYQSALLEEAGALVLAVDRRRRVTVWNRTLARLCGFSAREVIEKDVARWLDDSRHELVQALDEALDGRPPATVEIALPTRSGGQVRAAWNLAPVRAGGAIESVIAIGQDLTQLKALERQVIQAEKLATLGQIAAGVVHELNNPLTSITVYADFLLRKAEKSGAEGGDVEKLARIVEASNRMLRFTRDLVTYARPSGEERGAVSLDDVVREALSFCEHVLDRASAHVAITLGGTPPVLANRAQLQQVFINLFTNAAQALPKRGGEVRIETRREHDTVRVTIADQGKGISARDLPHVFEPFFTTKEPGKGTGLGLSIVRRIVEGHGGRVTASSEPGQGSEFVLLFPLR